MLQGHPEVGTLVSPRVATRPELQLMLYQSPHSGTLSNVRSLYSRVAFAASRRFYRTSESLAHGPVHRRPDLVPKTMGGSSSFVKPEGEQLTKGHLLFEAY